MVEASGLVVPVLVDPVECVGSIGQVQGDDAQLREYSYSKEIVIEREG